MTDSIDDKDFLKTLARGIEVIRSFDTETPRMTLTEVARKNDLSRASARRFLMTLGHLGYAIQIDGKFQLTAKILDLAYRYLSNLHFLEDLTPFMRQVSRTLGKACSAAVLDGTEIVYVARVPAREQILSVSLQIGSRLPAYCTSMGRVLLSDLSPSELDTYFEVAELKHYTDYTTVDPARLRDIIHQVGRDGYSVVDQELEESLRALAIPIHNFAGKVVCAINVGMPARQVEREEALSRYLPVLREAATKAEQVLAHHFE